MNARHRFLAGIAAIAAIAVACSENPASNDSTDDGSLAPLAPSGNGGLGGSAADAGGDGGCLKPNLTGIVRDFSDQASRKHPDFETFVGDGEKGIVEALLGPDDKPVYASATRTKFTTGKAAFDQWYRDVPGVNVAIPYTLVLTAGAGAISSFDSPAFFPIDGKGWGNDGRQHNYHFTFELHTTFRYDGGEVFSFNGDDDLWVFVNKHLAIDLGGVHDAKAGAIDFDARAAELGLTRGGTYDLAIFQAERHTPGSNFHVDTSVAFTNCTPILK
jgi:fibro-slime domain-containing protein